VVDKADQANTM
jgi:hypothetical protein